LSTAETTPGEQPGEEELRAAYEAELARMTTTDMMAQAAVSLLNLGARRLMPAAPGEGAMGERDLEQARDAIDAVRALLDVLERRIPQELAPLRDALSRLQMTYAREVGSTPGAPGAAASPEEGSGGSAPAPDQGPGAAGERPSGPGPAESSGRLWVPGR
jgi:hypothetical protein